MAGSPDCDIYYTDLQFGIPAVLNNYAQALEDFLPADSDVLNDQVIMKHLNVLDAPKNYLFAAEEKNAQGYPLGFNMDMIQENNLEDPRDLYDKGEWTWDKWREYLQVLTKDTNGDGVTDVYGYGGYWTNMLANMLLANNAHIAGDLTEGLSDPKTIETMEFFQTIYVTDKTARPWIDTDWETNLQPAFVDGLMAFFVTKDWIIQKFAGENGVDLTFELGVVPWPYGPSGKKEDSQKYLAEGNWCIIPVGVKDPALVYSVYYDYINWFKGDVEFRDEGGIFTWQEDMYMTERNLEMALENGKISAFDIWESLGADLSMVEIMNGTYTPAQYAEENRQVVQDQLNAYFGN
jgi:ABC-type glycerol-3-phosphate transport system substrate-binding protein